MISKDQTPVFCTYRLCINTLGYQGPKRERLHPFSCAFPTKIWTPPQIVAPAGSFPHCDVVCVRCSEWQPSLALMLATFLSSAIYFGIIIYFCIVIMLYSSQTFRYYWFSYMYSRNFFSNLITHYTHEIRAKLFKKLRTSAKLTKSDDFVRFQKFNFI